MRQKHGGRQKGTPNKVTSEVKDRLHDILDQCIVSINPSDMTHGEKIKTIQICLQYLIPKPKEENTDEQWFDKIEIEIIDGKNRKML